MLNNLTIPFKELEFYEDDQAHFVAGMVVQDQLDSEYCGIVFAKDQNGRFRCVSLTKHCETLSHVRVLLEQNLMHASMAEPSTHFQGDEEGSAIDFFSPLREKSLLNGSFLQLSEQKGFGAAKQIIELMMRWHNDADGNFVEQFQTAGFDQRIWELYLYAVFTELRYDLSKEHVVPDFVCSGLDGDFSVEAVTLGQTQDAKNEEPKPPFENEQEQLDYLNEYMPIRFSKALTKKRKKKTNGQYYWGYRQVIEHSLIFSK